MGGFAFCWFVLVSLMLGGVAEALAPIRYRTSIHQQQVRLPNQKNLVRRRMVQQNKESNKDSIQKSSDESNVWLEFARGNHQDCVGRCVGRIPLESI
jgi:hypothetical protein